MTQPEPVAMTPSHKPTMKLRFIERFESNPNWPLGGRSIRILQQMFVPKDWNTHDEEWRDVPLELDP